MWKGNVVSVYIIPAAAQPATAVEGALAVAGRGLEGDRYYKGTGTYSERPGPDREVTLIEIEAIGALQREKGIELEPGSARRNIVTRGVPLNHLVGREFQVGEATLRGVRLCEPCSHLAKLTEGGVLPGLVHRGGLRAQIVAGGTIRPGDTVEEVEAQAQVPDA